MSVSKKEWAVAELYENGELVYVIRGTTTDIEELKETYSKAMQGNIDALDKLKPLIYRMALIAGRSKEGAEAEASAVSTGAAKIAKKEGAEITYH
jgi:hypothetical protein